MNARSPAPARRAAAPLGAGAERGGPGRVRSGVRAPAVLLLVSTLIALALGELFLRAALNPGDYLFASVVEDPILGIRIAPKTSGHDALGFRNREVPQRVGIVALGDSQTYGVGVARDESWPQQLARLLREPVYSMALGGFGPLEELYLAEHEALRLRPRVLLVALYLGNDMADAHRAAHQRPYWYGWRETASAATPLPGESERDGREPRKNLGAVRDWLARRSVLYGFLRLRVFQRLALLEQDRLAARVPPDSRMVWIDPGDRGVRTIFTPQRRLSALDARRPEIHEGLGITKRAFAAMNHSAKAHGTRLLVVLIPTKERVYCRYLRRCGTEMPPALTRLCDVEDRVKADVEGFLSADAIAYVDATATLSEEVPRHAPIYPADSDGHPSAAGHLVIARVVSDALRRLEARNPIPR